MPNLVQELIQAVQAEEMPNLVQDLICNSSPLYLRSAAAQDLKRRAYRAEALFSSRLKKARPSGSSSGSTLPQPLCPTHEERDQSTAPYTYHSRRYQLLRAAGSKAPAPTERGSRTQEAPGTSKPCGLLMVAGGLTLLALGLMLLAAQLLLPLLLSALGHRLQLGRHVGAVVTRLLRRLRGGILR